MDWNDAYANAAYIEAADLYPEKWANEAQEFRVQHADHSDFDVAYGQHPREVYDHFRVSNPKGAIVFVHGGYWKKFDKNSWSHLARGGVERGMDVYIPSYPLCPDVRISDITKSLVKFINQLPQDMPIYLTGHSAGGHLVARLICEKVLDDAVLGAIKRVLPISGLFDLRPLLATQMNDILRLDLEEAQMESPVLLEANKVSVMLWVGENERPEFIRQSTLLANIWQGQHIDVEFFKETGKHHFDVIEGLADPHSPMLNKLLDIE